MVTSSRTLVRLVALAAVGLLLSPRVEASASEFPRAAVRTEELGVAPDGVGVAATLTFDEALVPALLALPEGGSLHVAGWPVAPGDTAPVLLTRHDIYAAGARIVRMEGEREVDLPRSRLVFYWGPVDDAPGERVLVSVDPEERTLRAVSMTRLGVHEMRPREPGSRANLLAPLEAWRTPGSPAPVFHCGEESLGLSSVAAMPAPRRERTALSVPGTFAVTKTGVVAVDTDNELLLQKFGNNTTAATDYLAKLFAQMNVIYERDLSLRLLEGYTILRVSTTADPWAQSGTGNADINKLYEFSGYWSSHYPHIRRMLGMLVSGKQGSGNSASGIAWLGGLCSSGNGYSFNQVFKFQQDTSAWDVLITAHEIGHNFGSPHTHCYGNPKPDTCYGGEPGANCFSGTGSCPGLQVINGVTSNGTLMSYCHLLSCGNTLVFHPETLIRYVNSAVSNATGVCLFNVSGTVPPRPTVSGVSPPAGSIGGGTPVTITGTSFLSGASVAFVDRTGSSAGTSVVVQSASTLTAVTPAHAAGAVDVVVMNPDFQTGTRTSGYTYVAGPSVTSISPNSGTTAGGTAVTISGSGFQAGATVTIGAVAATGVVVNANSVTATTGAHATGTVNVVVTNPDTSSATLAGAFFYAPPPASTRFYSLSPCRVVDTRGGAPVGGPALGPSAQRVLVLSGSCGLPANATSISANVTVVPTAAGFMTLFPGNGVNPGSSVINFGAGQVRANSAVLRLSTDGSGTIAVLNSSTGSNHLIIDVNGFFR